MQRVSRALRLVAREQRDMHDRTLEIDERVEAVIEKVDSLEVRLQTLEQQNDTELPTSDSN